MYVCTHSPFHLQSGEQKRPGLQLRPPSCCQQKGRAGSALLEALCSDHCWCYPFGMRLELWLLGWKSTLAHQRGCFPHWRMVLLMGCQPKHTGNSEMFGIKHNMACCTIEVKTIPLYGARKGVPLTLTLYCKYPLQFDNIVYLKHITHCACYHTLTATHFYIHHAKSNTAEHHTQAMYQYTSVCAV